jgi:hypothetical protein
MKFLLGTDQISVLQRQSRPEYSALITHMAQVPRADLAFCIGSFREHVLGWLTRLARRPLAFVCRHFVNFVSFCSILAVSCSTAALPVLEQKIAKATKKSRCEAERQISRTEHRGAADRQARGDRPRCVSKVLAVSCVQEKRCLLRSDIPRSKGIADDRWAGCQARQRRRKLESGVGAVDACITSTPFDLVNEQAAGLL